jgi:hypothetical protein
MSKTLRALLTFAALGFSSGLASTPSSQREFQTREGLVRIAVAPASASAESDSAGNANPVPAFDLESVGDLTALSLAEDRDDPLLEIYFLDHASGEELRFPAKLSHLRDFLKAHADQFTGGTPEERSVAMVKALSAGMQVHMVAPENGESK